MKKSPLLFLFLFFLLRLPAQDLGAALHFLEYFPAYARTSVPHTVRQLPGMRVEWNAVNKGFYGVNFNYFFPQVDSAEVEVLDSYGSLDFKRGTERKSTLDAGFRFGVGIPQGFNEFLRIYLGGGIAFTRTKVETLSPRTGSIYPSVIHFYPGVSTELLGGVAYELEKVYLFAQYSYIYTISELSDMPHRNGLSVGLFIPIIRK